MSDFRDFQEKYTHERIEGIVKRLRRMADDIEREAKHALSLDSAVSTTIHTVMWGTANLGLDILASNLARYYEVDRIERGANDE